MILIFLVLAGVCVLDFLGDVISSHGKYFFDYLFSLVKSLINYGFTVGTLLVACEISENVYDIKMGNKTPASTASPIPAAKPAAPAAKPAEKAETENSADAE